MCWVGAVRFEMRAHYLQHVSFEGLGSIETWLKGFGYEISCTQFFKVGVLPDLRDIDLLVVMGGPMSVNNEEEYPWLVQEKAFIRSAIELGKPVLGICLGAQLINQLLDGENSRLFACREWVCGLWLTSGGKSISSAECHS